MIFSSSSFIIFLLVVLSIYSNCKTSDQRALVLLISSFTFYATWKPVYLILFISSLAFNYLIYSKLLAKPSIALLIFGVSVNIFALGFFKYTVLFFDTIVWLNSKAEYPLPERPVWIDWALPLGISFFTFHMLSALIDVYKQEWDKKLTFRQWCLYVSFFPQFIAGPISRASELVDQLSRLAPLRWIDLRAGALIFAGGLIKKALLADNLSPLVDMLYSQPKHLDFFLAWFATTAFGLQIYFDFSGYSEMATGLGRMFGVRLPRNFKHPYISKNCSEFWHRWHMTLSRWLRDYLFIPLGGSRCPPGRTFFNLLTTMLLGGLWHGAGWNFVFWGLLHGLYLIGHRLIKDFYNIIDLKNKTVLNWSVGRLSLPFTLCLISFTWVFFRATNFDDAWIISKTMLHLNNRVSNIPEVRAYLKVIVAISLTLVFIEPAIEKLFLKTFKKWRTTPFYVRGTVYATIAMSVHIFGGNTQKFIYFDF